MADETAAATETTPVVPAVPAAPAAPAEKTLTQADVDRIVAERLNRERAKYADYDGLKEAASQVGTLTERLAALEAEATAAKTKAAETARKSAVVAAASKHGAVSPEQVFRLLDAGALEVDDNLGVKGAEEAVSAFLEANPHFVGAKPIQVGGHLGAGAKGQAAPDLDTQIREATTAGDWKTVSRLQLQKLGVS